MDSVPAPVLVIPNVVPEIAPNVASVAVVPVTSAILHVCEEPRTTALATVSVLLPVSATPEAPVVIDPAPVMPMLVSAHEIAMPSKETLLPTVSPAPSDVPVHVAMSPEPGRTSQAAKTVRSAPVPAFVAGAAPAGIAERTK